jgi:putative transposase
MCYYRLKYGLVGHLWQGRYKSLIIDTERYLLQCGKYIELNPVRAGYVSYPDQYSFSSYNAYVSDKPDPLVTFSPLYKALGEDSNARQSHYMNIVLDEAKMNKQALSRKTIIGSEDFVKKLRERIKLVTKDEEVIEFKYSV